MYPFFSQSRRIQSAGFTLIELMISMTIGALVLTAATGLVITAADSRSIVKHMAELQEEAFFVTHTLKQQLSQAGYRGLNIASTTSRAMPVASRSDYYPSVSGEWDNGQLVKVVNNTLFYRFDGASLSDGTPDGSIYDCLGNPIAFGALQETTLSIQSNRLVCTVGSNSTWLIGGGAGTRVEQIHFLLGIDTNNDGGIDQIVDSASATTNDFINTQHLTVRMLLTTRDGIIKYNQTYRYNGAETTATDHRLRTEVVVSVAMRN